MKDLVAAWRDRANGLEPYSGAAAHAWRSAASALEVALREYDLQELSLEQACEESGYSYSSLQKKLASGELENVGSKGSPRIRRGELPMKGGKPPGLTLADRAVVARRS